MDTYEKQFFLPTNICNNKEYIEQNKKRFERNFVYGDNLEEIKLSETSIFEFTTSSNWTLLP